MDNQDSTPKPRKPYKSKNVRNKHIKAMAAAGMTQRDIAKQVDLAPSRVNAIISQSFTPAEMAAFKDIEANLLAKKRYEIIKSIDEHDIKKANLTGKAMAYGVFYDKQALLENRATSISDVDIRHLVASIVVDNPVDNSIIDPE